MATKILFNIALGNGLLPDGTVPLTELILIYYQLDLYKEIFNQNKKVFIQENAFENAVCKSAILSLPPGPNALLYDRKSKTDTKWHMYHRSALYIKHDNHAFVMWDKWGPC